MLKRTALFEQHQQGGGYLIDFGGWELPVRYSSVMEEHLACRSAAGLFDVSHMGEVHVEGPLAEAYLDHLVTNQVSKLSIGRAQYTVMCNEHGGIIDDLVIYRRAADCFLVVINAGNTEKDFKHFINIKSNFHRHSDKLKVTNESGSYTQIAIQGRSAAKILQPLTAIPLLPIKTYGFTEGKLLGKIPIILARTGYTGEDGFELYLPWKQGPEVWISLLEIGSPLGLMPCGLGARDTLRLEMKYPLYGHELTEETNPIEAGLSWVVKFDKGDFVGKSALLQMKANGMKRKLVGFHLLERGIPRQGYIVYDHEGKTPIGQVTSGTHSPSLKQAIGIAYIAKPHCEEGSKIMIDIRGTKILGAVVGTPFYQRDYSV